MSNTKAQTLMLMHVNISAHIFITYTLVKREKTPMSQLTCIRETHRCHIIKNLFCEKRGKKMRSETEIKMDMSIKVKKWMLESFLRFCHENQMNIFCLLIN